MEIDIDCDRGMPIVGDGPSDDPSPDGGLGEPPGLAGPLDGTAIGSTGWRT